MKRSLNPTWNETFEIEVDHYDKLILDVYDENRMTRDDFLGRAIIDTSIATTSKCSLDLGNCNEETCLVLIILFSQDLEKRSSKSNVSGKISVTFSLLPSPAESCQQRSNDDVFMDIFDGIVRYSKYIFLNESTFLHQELQS